MSLLVLFILTQVINQDLRENKLQTKILHTKYGDTRYNGFLTILRQKKISFIAIRVFRHFNLNSN